MTTQASARLSATAFTAVERRKLHALRRHYLQVPDAFTGQERARLRFLRWLHETQRLSP